MAFLKAHWLMIALGVVCLGSIGGAAWAVAGADSVEQKMQKIDALVREVKRCQTGAANSRTIEAKQKEKEEEAAEFERTEQATLAMQKNNAFYEEVDADGTVTPSPRKTLIPDVLPKPKRSADAIAFRTAYIREFALLRERLNGRDKASEEEIANEAARVEQLKGGDEEESAVADPWGPPKAAIAEETPGSEKKKSLRELLREYPRARAAEKVAQSIYMYLDEHALGRHQLADPASTTPHAVEIWQAQMSLWIQQDIVTALSRCNEARVKQLMEQGHRDRLWVAYMPVKRLKRLGIMGVLGKGGGSNEGGWWPDDSFTKAQNNDKRFVVPLRLDLVIEEGALADVLDRLTSVGFYTPINVKYKAVTPDALCETYIYGDKPVVDVTIYLEGYYFRKVFEDWIPAELKPILKRPGASEEETGFGRR
jgi:hypothetical protein